MLYSFQMSRPKQTNVMVGKVNVINSHLDKQMFFFWWLGNCFYIFLYIYIYIFFFHLNKVYYSEDAQQVMQQATNLTNITV